MDRAFWASPVTDASAYSLSVPSIDRPLNDEERSVLDVLMQQGRGARDRGVIAIATALQRETAETGQVLRRLETDGLVASEVDATLEETIWFATDEASEALDPPG